MSKASSKLISVIIPIYKVEPYLRHCIESVLNQTYSNFEVILVNDGSPDGCGVICDEYSKKHKNVKVIHKKNGGLSDTRNAGLDIAKGDYITFIDSDDWVDKKYLEYLHELLIEEQADISICDYLRTKNECIKQDLEKIEKFTCTNKEGLNHLFGPYYIQFIVAWGKLYKKSLFHNLRFPIGKLHEDEFTVYKLIFRANKIAVSSNKLYFYRLRKDGIMATSLVSLKSRLDAIEAFRKRMQFYKEIKEPELYAKTTKLCFTYYKKVYDNLNSFDSSDERNLFEKDVSQFKKILRKSQQNIKFRFYYELYFLSPIITNFLSNFYLGFISKKNSCVKN